MHNHEFDEQQGPIAPEDLLDLNEIMRAFGIDEWQNLGPALPTHTESLNLLVEAEGQRYILRERPEGMVGEDLTHRYAFQRYLQREGIPIPDLPTLGIEYAHSVRVIQHRRALIRTQKRVQIEHRWPLEGHQALG